MDVFACTMYIQYNAKWFGGVREAVELVLKFGVDFEVIEEFKEDEKHQYEFEV